MKKLRRREVGSLKVDWKVIGDGSWIWILIARSHPWPSSALCQVNIQTRCRYSRKTDCFLALGSKGNGFLCPHKWNMNGSEAGAFLSIPYNANDADRSMAVSAGPLLASRGLMPTCNSVKASETKRSPNSMVQVFSLDGLPCSWDII